MTSTAPYRLHPRTSGCSCAGWQAAWPVIGSSLQWAHKPQTPHCSPLDNAVAEAGEGTHPRSSRWKMSHFLFFFFFLSYDFGSGGTQPDLSFPCGVVLRWCRMIQKGEIEQYEAEFPLQSVLPSVVPPRCLSSLSVLLLQIAVLRSDESLLSAALSRCCFFPFSSSLS